MAKRKCDSCHQVVESTSVYCPKCGGKIKKRNIFIFSILMIVLFTIVIELAYPLFALLFEHGATVGKYGSDLLFELLLVVFMVIILFLSKNTYVFTEKKVGFFKGLLLGLPMLIFCIYVTLTSIPSLLTNFNFANFVSLLFFCATVGIAEELLCRAWLQNEFIERFGSTKKGVFISILLSSLVFGFMHITNIISTPQGAFETFMQIFQALGSGFLFGAIYYKTKNIWNTAFLHGFFDFALMLSEVNLLKSCNNSYTNAVVVVFSVITTLLIISFYVFGGLFALSSKQGVKVFKEKDNNRLRTIGIIGVVASIVLFIGASFAEGMFFDDSEYLVCFEYEEKEFNVDYEVTTTNKEDFKFKANGYNYELYKNKNGELMLASSDNTIKLDFDGSLENYIVVDNEDTIDIVIEYAGAEYYIYYVKLLKIQMENSTEYLETVKDNFTRIDLPNLSYIGYVVFDKDDTKYPYFKSKGSDELYIDAGEKLYVIKR